MRVCVCVCVDGWVWVCKGIGGRQVDDFLVNLLIQFNFLVIGSPKVLLILKIALISFST